MSSRTDPVQLQHVISCNDAVGLQVLTFAFSNVTQYFAENTARSGCDKCEPIVTQWVVGGGGLNTEQHASQGTTERACHSARARSGKHLLFKNGILTKVSISAIVVGVETYLAKSSEKDCFA